MSDTPAIPDEITETAISVMKQAGEAFAREQRSRWHRDEWRMGEAVSRQHVLRWTAVEEEVSRLVGLLKRGH